MCPSPLVSLTLTLLPAVLPSSTLLTKMPKPCSEPPRTLKPSLPSTLFSTVMALMTSLSLLLAVGTGEQMCHPRLGVSNGKGCVSSDKGLLRTSPDPGQPSLPPDPGNSAVGALLATGVGRGLGHPTHLRWGR